MTNRRCHTCYRLLLCILICSSCLLVNAQSVQATGQGQSGIASSLAHPHPKAAQALESLFLKNSQPILPNLYLARDKVVVMADSAQLFRKQKTALSECTNGRLPSSYERATTPKDLKGAKHGPFFSHQHTARERSQRNTAPLNLSTHVSLPHNHAFQNKQVSQKPQLPYAGNNCYHSLELILVGIIACLAGFLCWISPKRHN